MASLAWLWNPTKRLFQNIAKGITLTKAQLIKARDTFVTARAPTLAAITDRLIKGDISLTQWEGEMQQAIADQFTAQYLLGRGGTDAMTDADKAALAGAIAEQFGFLRTFTQDIAGGRLSAAQIGARAAMYGESSVQAHGMGQGAAFGIDLPCWPADGGTVCNARCRCSWDISDTGDAIEATWQTVGGNRVCDGCEERGAMYNPLVFPKALDGEAEA